MEFDSESGFVDLTGNGTDDKAQAGARGNRAGTARRGDGACTG